LDNARKSFCLAAKATEIKETERHAAMGRDYLQLAHKACQLDDGSRATTFGNVSWQKPQRPA